MKDSSQIISSTEESEEVDIDSNIIEESEEGTVNLNENDDSSSPETTVLKEQYETDYRKDVMSFEDYVKFITTMNSLDSSQFNTPEVGVSPFGVGSERDIVAEARKHLGKPYTQTNPTRLGPNAFDCSGLAYYVFKTVTGRDIGNVTWTQEYAGDMISVSQAKPGDLFFWGSRGSTYHVAIYIGNNQYIHSPTFGKTVEVSPIWWNDFAPSFAIRMDLKEEQPPQGPWIADGRYVTITQKGHNLWGSFNWDKKDTTDNLFNKTYQAQGHYKHSNGSTYYSLYDSKGSWKGYLDSKAATVAKGAGGIWLPSREYITFTQKDKIILGDVDSQSVNQNNTNNFFQKTFRANGKYNHFSGKVYYSIYDTANTWVGYLDTNSMGTSPGAHGVWLPNDEYYTVTSKDKPVWANIDNFSTQHSNTTNEFEKTYHASGKYSHYNGKVYYSLYDSSGRWKGYYEPQTITKGNGRQGVWLNFGKNVKLTKPGVPIWGDINNLGDQKGTTSDYLNQTIYGYGKYNHFSGNTYISLYKNGTWIGYVDLKDVIVVN